MTEYNNNFEREFGWDDTIQEDAKEFITLQPGDYVFTVTDFERARHTPNPQKIGKLPACNKAVISLEIETDEGVASLKHNLFLHSSTEGMLSAFFGAIGQKKHGEPLKMNWNTVVGATGVCSVKNRTYNDNFYNEVKSMIYADSVDWTKVLNANTQPQAPQPTYQQPAQQTTNFAPQQQPAPQSYQQGQMQAPQQQGGWGGF
ncbi:hypothetical protein POF63_03155 [Streptococcus agalactiae]|uniref:hypothetical protein n=1 Tax=Streptococcus agalactiae TaxID=1311 RepID=UPI0005303513|nr:hypothetical protein [Streptococcus agalactiae]AIX04340.1 hypothetical protein W903_0642 [Streptococcus agalactiae CNCTC 10/84]UXJ89999.1 hypothetical protein N7J23_03155 [Streptococcus agalactiae]UXJ91898.1 hypothetical protein N7J24_03155 [Streptococcus agalactiae]UXJ93801.1 hypothetical protein N7J25_03150 [Streptococcus agalactiae]WHU67641.1 hypothetical protein POF59_03155 [Streptococcus agalactiae]